MSSTSTSVSLIGISCNGRNVQVLTFIPQLSTNVTLILWITERLLSSDGKPAPLDQPTGVNTYVAVICDKIAGQSASDKRRLAKTKLRQLLWRVWAYHRAVDLTIDLTLMRSSHFKLLYFNNSNNNS